MHFSNHSRQLRVTQAGQPAGELTLPFMAFTEHCTASMGASSAGRTKLVVKLPIRLSLDALREVPLLFFERCVWTTR